MQNSSNEIFEGVAAHFQSLSDSSESARSPMSRAFSDLEDAIGETYNLIEALAQRIQPCLNPMSKDIQGSDTAKSSSNSRIVDHVFNEASRVNEINRGLRSLIERVEL